MEWQAWSSELIDLLALRGSPVAVTYSPTPASNASEDRRIWACRAFQAARDGVVINLSAETSGCPGGTTYLGFSGMPPDRATTIADFLVNGEKLMASHAVFGRARMTGVPTPQGVAPYVVFSPLNKAELRPDLVLFLCTPLQASRIVTLVNFEVGEPIVTRLTGSTCSGAISEPMFTGQVSLSLIDTTSRHSCKYREDELILTVPYHRMHGMMRSIDRCSAGRAPIEWPEPMRQLMKE